MFLSNFRVLTRTPSFSYQPVLAIIGAALAISLHFDAVSILLCLFISIVGCFCFRGLLTAQGISICIIIIVGALAINLWNCWISASYAFYTIGAYGVVGPSNPSSFVLQLSPDNTPYAVLTASIGFFAFIYAYVYMSAEPKISVFLLYLASFLGGMLVLLIAESITSLILGWELIGLSSYLLINFWSSRVYTFKSAFKAFTFNKLSDACLLLSCCLLYLHGSEPTLSAILPNCIAGDDSTLYFVGILLIVCANCKSAQFLFHTWLPDSMEAPVPASALIHSATLVSAGIYLLSRFYPLLSYFDSLLWYIALSGSFTAAYGGIVASYQTDLKRILAYSTISHCGFMMVLVSYGDTSSLVIYLHMHGWFKSFCFMLVGLIISANGGLQDYRRMGSCSWLSLGYNSLFSVGMISLGGLPFMAGFFNKHFLLISVSSTGSHFFSTAFCLVGAFTGIFYSIRTCWGVLGAVHKNLFFVQSPHRGVSRTHNLSVPFIENFVKIFFPMLIFVSVTYVLSLDFSLIRVSSIYDLFFFTTYIILVGCMLASNPYLWAWAGILLVKITYLV